MSEASRAILPTHKLILAEKAITYRTIHRHSLEIQSDRIDSQETAKAFLGPILDESPVEALYAVALNSSGDLMGILRVSQGTVDRAACYPRELVSFLLIETNATSLILAHNHPGGRCEPSAEDLALTARLSDILKPLGVRLLDHFIYATGRPGRDGEWHSLRTSGQIP
jgi:DNA repair protein RadC